jgi:hypothetical protein
MGEVHHPFTEFECLFNRFSQSRPGARFYDVPIDDDFHLVFAAMVDSRGVVETV